MITTSPSELVLADDCGRAHDYRYNRRLRLLDEKRSPTLASGSAVHAVIENWCRDFGGTMPTSIDLAVRAEDALADEFDGDTDGGKKNMKRFLPGVKRALGLVPDYVWEEPLWNVEREVEGFFGTEELGGEGATRVDGEAGIGPAVRLHGYPDMYRLLDDGETDVVEIVDTKTTDTDPLDFVLWTPQIRFYGAMLAQKYPGRLIVYRYMCLPTKVGGTAPHSPAFIMNAAAIKKAGDEILMYASKLAGVEPRYSRRCVWCPFAPICKTIVTGGDGEGVIEDLYYVKEKTTNG